MDRLLTPGALKKMLEDALPVSVTFQPLVQVTAFRPITKNGPNAGTRYRVLIHDGVHSTASAMLSSTCSAMVEDESLTTNSLFKILDYSMSGATSGKKVICISQLKVIKTGAEVGQALGKPTPYKLEASTTTEVSSAPSTNPQPLKESNNTGTGFYGGKPQSNAAQHITTAPKQEPKSAPTPGTPGTPGGTPSRIYPIASLTPYQNRWTIKCRVTQKSNVRTYSNSRGEGKFFNCVFTDESGEIKATAWKNECDVFFDMIELNKVYLVSKAQLKTANKQFSHVNNDYEMNLSADTKIIPCDHEEASNVPTMQFTFVPIEELINKQVGSLVDVCGVVVNVGEMATIVAKTSQREMMKRDLELGDDSGMSVRLTLWGEEAKTFPEESGQIVAIKGAKISDWNGRSLSSLSSSQLIMNPDCADAHRLRGWHMDNGANFQFRSYTSDGGASASGGTSTSWKTLDCLRKEKLGMGDKPDYYLIKGYVAFIKRDNCMYTSCPSEGCNKKVLDNGDGTYRCEKCNKSSEQFKYRLLLQMHVCDTMGYHWVTAFQDSAEKILGKTAQEMGEMRDNEELFDYTLKSSLWKPYQMKVRSKMEVFNEDQRMKSVLVDLKDLDTPSYNKRILSDIRSMLAAAQ